jgi:hypothetical protein
VSEHLFAHYLSHCNWGCERCGRRNYDWNSHLSLWRATFATYRDGEKVESFFFFIFHFLFFPFLSFFPLHSRPFGTCKCDTNNCCSEKNTIRGRSTMVDFTTLPTEDDQPRYWKRDNQEHKFVELEEDEKPEF